ncbi:hypothetical protein [Glaciecola petra]|uniref:Uncharacterized protein n=1 Tax=Glaciecola petra TaxID=3075602 RepID=A0ABU2ZLX3_9ALTE|nr:hypothetical protein [Aestuariibacter sp. P117]MDT0593626.1 hypothetical protein [Aestuariibacter sp. P117]
MSAFVVFDKHNWHTYVIQVEHLIQEMHKLDIQYNQESFAALDITEQEQILLATGLVKSKQSLA